MLSKELTNLAAQLLPKDDAKQAKRGTELDSDAAPLRARLVESWHGQVTLSQNSEARLVRVLSLVSPPLTNLHHCMKGCTHVEQYTDRVRHHQAGVSSVTERSHARHMPLTVLHADLLREAGGHH